jgi:hypothetical protein
MVNKIWDADEDSSKLKRGLHPKFQDLFGQFEQDIDDFTSKY